MTLLRIVSGILLVAWTFGAGALTLGDSHGAVTLGYPVDVTFDVRPDPGQELEASCLAARVVSGSTPTPDGRISVTNSLGTAGNAKVRVRSGVPVDEPVVTVTLSAGCTGRVSRTYAFLADLPSMHEPELAGSSDGSRPVRKVVDPEMPPDARLPTRTAAAPARPQVQRAQPRRTSTSAAAARSRAAQRKLPPSRQTPSPSPNVSGQNAAPKLLIEPLELWAETPPTLQLAREPMQMPAPPLDESARSHAIATWQALNMPPEQVLQAESKRAQQEAEIVQLRQQLEKERTDSQSLRQHLEQVESERYGSSVVYLLVVLLLLALLALAWLMRRGRRDEPDEWQQSVALSEEKDESSGVSAGLADKAVFGSATVGSAGGKAAEPSNGEQGGSPVVAPIDSQSSRSTGLVVDPVSEAKLSTLPAALSISSTTATSEPRAQHIEHPEDLFDILQQAEFFISIGEHEQAISGLKKHVAQHPDSSPLAYLELLRLYHMLGRIDGFEDLRGQFHRYFNAQVPSFAEFQHGGRALEDYPEELARIEALWASPEVLVLLDGFMFRREDEQSVQPFDLPAYEDLLLLLAVVQTTPAKERGSQQSRKRTTPDMPRAPRALVRSLDSTVGDLSLQTSAFQPLGEGKGESLDIDLTVPFAHALPQASASRVDVVPPGNFAPPPVDFDLSQDKSDEITGSSALGKRRDEPDL